MSGRKKYELLGARAIQGFWAASNSNLYSARAANGEEALSWRPYPLSLAAPSRIKTRAAQKSRERYIRRILYMIIRHHQLWPPARASERDDLSRQYVTRRTLTHGTHQMMMAMMKNLLLTHYPHFSRLRELRRRESTKNTRQLRNKAAGGEFFSIWLSIFSAECGSTRVSNVFWLIE